MSLYLLTTTLSLNVYIVLINAESKVLKFNSKSIKVCFKAIAADICGSIRSTDT